MFILKIKHEVAHAVKEKMIGDLPGQITISPRSQAHCDQHTNHVTSLYKNEHPNGQVEYVHVSVMYPAIIRH